jgi:hypothetical protein
MGKGKEDEQDHQLSACHEARKSPREIKRPLELAKALPWLI